MDRKSILSSIERKRIIVICRRVYGEDMVRLMEALVKGGLQHVEVTFDQVDPACIEKTCNAIRLIQKELGNSIVPGAGTVLSIEQVNAAMQAGAQYIISPNVDHEVIKATLARGGVSIPGAATPTEILSAHKLGADYVKLFPAGTLGFSYAKDILAPITHVKLIATGGVTEENWPEYKRLGFVGAGVSGRLCDKKLIAEGNYGELTRRAQQFLLVQ